MLPRLKPRCFYDLVIEVAIVRPGPIQGGMIHPYLRRRDKLEKVTYPSDEVRRVLAKTLGVPIFQEQVMRLAVVAAGFTPGEADQLRRSMAAWRRNGAIERFQVRLMQGMLERGYARQFAEQIYMQIRGFGEYGFPESHSASFALLVYASAWLKRYHPAAFAAAIINSQPMGFYAPAQLVRDALEHGVEVRGVDVNFSGWDCSLEERDEVTERRRDEVKERHEGTKARGHEGGVQSSALHESDGATPQSEPEAQAEGESDEAIERWSGEGEHRQPADHGEHRRPAGAGDEGSGTGDRGSGGAGLGALPKRSAGMACEEDHAIDGRHAGAALRHGTRAPGEWGAAGPAMRLGFRMVRGLSEEKVRGIVAAQRELSEERHEGTKARRHEGEHLRPAGANDSPSNVQGRPPGQSKIQNPKSKITSIRQLARRPDVSRETLLRLAAADAFRSLGLNRREALWQILLLDSDETALRRRPASEPRPSASEPRPSGRGRRGDHTLPLFDELEPVEPPVKLPEMTPSETVVQDYNATGLSLNAHPIGLLREELDLLGGRHGGTKARSHEGEHRGPAGAERSRDREIKRSRTAGAMPKRSAGMACEEDDAIDGSHAGAALLHGTRIPSNPKSKIQNAKSILSQPVLRNVELKSIRNGRRAAVAGLVLVRQRPGTAKGIIFMTIEDETGVANLVIRPHVWERFRSVARASPALIAEGVVEKQGEVIHLMVNRLHDLTACIAAARQRPATCDVIQSIGSRSRDFH